MTIRLSKFAFLVPIVPALLAGCGQNPAPDAPATPATAAQAGPAGATGKAGESWELVQLERQDPPNQDLAMLRDGPYQLCAAVASQLKVPVKPFPVAPDDYRNRRITRITNGTSWVVKEEYIGGGEDAPSMDPKTGCEHRLPTDRHVMVQITHAGKSTHILDGKVTDVEEVPPWPEYAPRGKPTTEYTQARTVNGVPLRCLPPDFWTLNTNKYLDLREMCVYATDNVVVDESGDPVTVLSHSLVNLVNPKYKHTAILEPLSMRRIGKDEKDPYQVASWVR